MLAKKILHGVSGELRITSALCILGGHRMALGCSGLHANGCFKLLMPVGIAPRRKIYVEIAPPSLTVSTLIN